MVLARSGDSTITLESLKLTEDPTEATVKAPSKSVNGSNGAVKGTTTTPSNVTSEDVTQALNLVSIADLKEIGRSFGNRQMIYKEQEYSRTKAY